MLKMFKNFFNYLKTRHIQNKINALFYDATLLRRGAAQRMAFAALANRTAQSKEIEAYALMREHGILRDPSNSDFDNCF